MVMFCPWSLTAFSSSPRLLAIVMKILAAETDSDNSDFRAGIREPLLACKESGKGSGLAPLQI